MGGAQLASESPIPGTVQAHPVAGWEPHSPMLCQELPHLPAQLDVTQMCWGGHPIFLGLNPHLWDELRQVAPGARLWREVLVSWVLRFSGWRAGTGANRTDVQISNLFLDDNRLLIQQLFIVHIKGSCPLRNCSLFLGRTGSFSDVSMSPPYTTGKTLPYTMRQPPCIPWASPPMYHGTGPLYTMGQLPIHHGADTLYTTGQPPLHHGADSLYTTTGPLYTTGQALWTARP